MQFTPEYLSEEDRMIQGLFADVEFRKRIDKKVGNIEKTVNRIEKDVKRLRKEK